MNIIARYRNYLLVAVGLALLGAVVLFVRLEFSTPTPSAVPSKIVELKDGDTFDLTAGWVEKKIGSSTIRMLAYNGSIPGPFIKVPQGAEITVKFTNNTDIDSTLHSHGIRMDNAFDGTPTLTQPPVPAGGTFSYKLKFPDTGLYWYHPHVREDYAQELGLYGNFLVTSANDSYGAPVNQEIPLVLDDVVIEGGQIRVSKTSTDHVLMGRFGNTMLINGDTDYNLQLKKGEVVRFYVTNTANVRPFNFGIAGTRLKLIGSDGGAYEQEQWSDHVLIGPSERAVVDVLFDKPGTFAIENKAATATTRLGMVSVSDQPITTSYAASFETLAMHEDVVKSIDPFRPDFAREPDKQLSLSVAMPMASMMNAPGMDHGSHMMADGTMMSGSMMSGAISADGIEWEDTMPSMASMQGVVWQITDTKTGAKNSAINWQFKVGEKVKIHIVNDANGMHPMQHPIHFHGQRFLVLSQNGKPNADLVWKDTVLVPAGQSVDILLDASNPGTWMAHCHISEHMESGMMFSFVVQ